MSQHVLLILREGQPPRCVGPLLSPLSADRIVELEGLREGEYLLQPLESPTARHRLIPSSRPRDQLCKACGEPFLPTHSAAAPGPTVKHSFRDAMHVITEQDAPDHVAHAVDSLLRQRDKELGPRGVRALYEQTPPPESYTREPRPGMCRLYQLSACGCAERGNQCELNGIDLGFREVAQAARGVRELYELSACEVRDLAADGRPITSWVEGHADQLRRFVPHELPQPPKEIDP